MKIIVKRNWAILVVILLSFWAIMPLFHPGFFPMHDDTQVARVFEMGKALRDGMFPVRWVSDLGYGYGYPIFNFYAPLAYYVGGLFTILGFDALIGTKIMMGIGILLSGIFMYLLAREFWGEMGGVLSGLFYVYAPYHALDIYVRGDVAEFWGYAFVPLAFYGVHKIYKDYKHYKKWIVVGSLGFAGIILSHNLTALMVSPFLLIVILIYCYIAYKNKRLFASGYLLVAIFLGLALSAFYWLPALLEIKYTNVLSQIGAGADFRDHFVCLGQLWDSPWGFGGSAPGCIDGFSFRVGKLHIIGSVIALILMFFLMRNKNYNSYKHYILLAFVGFILSVFFMLEISKPIWEAIPAMAFFQYPWRFLLLASFFASLVSGGVIWFPVTMSLRGGTTKQSLFQGIAALIPFARNDKLARAVIYLTFVFLIFSLIYFNSKLFQPQTSIPKTASDYTNEYALKWTASKISDEFLPPNFKKPKLEREIAKRPAVLPQETFTQKISNTISLGGIVVLALGIIIKDKKRLSV